ncbi:DUF1622 domain-containing protein [Psychrobacter sp. YP14]|jgi:uncharacterized membrane protein|uniref:DUF1622 domain-containing protein n=3 Tax=Psychrobacter TaxID=497 RepID=A0A844LYL1_9GAMM|nr:MULTISPECIES: DUF1622 domain-containing protein [Psychrobacter]AWT48131.1 DUF1622 domain-containing protein [Psychrobacter sp. YP14]MUG31746.1 DUF1622 domain-containing protein [Psychrobacter sanguinis]UNK05459.1 DUF1622 domain-containing protein [Psychrobacter sp. PraFG1]
MPYLIESIDLIAKIVEFIGVMIMFIGLILAFYKAAISSNKFSHDTYLGVRQGVGKSILLGLEVLIAADIMATVVTEPTLRSVVVLGVIVIIRTFLSLSLQVELEGRFPWQHKNTPQDKE